ncbi:MAG: amidohydrolase family protein [Bifidobacteriaceae bacterium]|jgi:imidazolonepropionase-like amidohydrolase|nr:amidohydrolase family protein [Bifidobacteriaceae bacterium]
MARTILTGGAIFDGTGGPIAVSDVAIENGTIAAVGRGLATRPGDETVDIAGLTLAPGFIDTHVHVGLSTIDYLQGVNMPFSYQFFMTEQNLKATLDVGITTVRDASGADLGVQRAVEDGLIDGPAVLLTIIALSQTGGHGDHWLPSGNAPEILGVHPGRPSGVVDGVDEARKRVRELIRNGANWIKVNTSGGVFSPRDDPTRQHFSDEELTAIVAEAERLGVHVMAHAHGSAGIKAAIRAGVTSVEHGTDLDDDAIEMMLERGTWLVPTLGVGQYIVDRVDAGDAIPPEIARKAKANGELRADSLAKAIAAGVRIAMGSDCAATAHGTNLIEFRLMHEMGLGPLAVLHSATGAAAELIGVADKVGTVAPGKQADLVLIAGDPFDFGAYPGNLRAVYRRGQRVRDYPAAG